MLDDHTRTRSIPLEQSSVVSSVRLSVEAARSASATLRDEAVSQLARIPATTGVFRGIVVGLAAAAFFWGAILWILLRFVM